MSRDTRTFCSRRKSNAYSRTCTQSGVYLNSEHTALKYARKKKDSHTFEADVLHSPVSRVPLTGRAIISRLYDFVSAINVHLECLVMHDVRWIQVTNLFAQNNISDENTGFISSEVGVHVTVHH